MGGLTRAALAGQVLVARNRLARCIAVLHNARWKKHENLARCLALVGVLLVMFCRAPCFFLTPRLWAEEGVYFSNAYHFAHTSLWYKGLLHLLGGYLDLSACVASTVAANCVSVENAPYVTLVFAVAAQLLPFVIVLWSNSPFWQPPLRKAAGVCILLFLPLSGEVWLTTLQSKMFFTLAILLLLLENAPATALKRWGYRLVVLIGGLSGPGSCIMTPFFLVGALKEKSKERLIQGVILSLCTVVQGTLLRFYPDHDRGAINPAVYLLSLWSQSVGLVLLGVRRAAQSGSFFHRLYQEGSPWFVPAALACAVVIGLIFVFFAKAVPSRDRWILVGMYFFLTLVSYWGALNEDKHLMLVTGHGQRYYFVPNAILLLLILARCRGPRRLGRLAATAVLVVSIGLGIAEYRKTLFRDAHWTKWNDEVQAWREDPTREIAIWPPGWHVRLASLQSRPQTAPLPAQHDAAANISGATRR